MAKAKVTDEMVDAFRVASRGTTMSDEAIKTCLQAALDARGKKPPPAGRAELLAILGEVLTAEMAGGIIDHRLALRKPLTPLAAKILVKEMNACGDPMGAAGMMLAKGWQGFQAAWYERERAGSRGSYGNGGGLAGAREQLMQEYADDRHERAPSTYHQDARYLPSRR